MKGTVAIYARISNEKDDIDVSIAQQIEQGKEFAKSKGMDYLIYKDEGFSGTLEASERPAMYELLGDIIKKNSKIKILWGREHFRLYRGNTPKTQIQLVCLKNKVDIYYGDKLYKPTDPMEKAMDGILGVMGEFYVDLTKQNVKQTLAKNFRDAKAHGAAPYGYRTGKGKLLEIDPDQSKEVKNMFKWHIEGMGVAALAKRMNDLGIPTMYDPKKNRYSKTWDKTTIYAILKNKLYCGIRTHNQWDMSGKRRKLLSSKEIPVPHLAIISEDTYNKSLLAFERNKSYTGKRTLHKYLLNDLVVCGQCQDRYLGRSDNKNITVYRCNGKRKQQCKNRDVRKDIIEKFMWDYFTTSDVLIKNLMEASKNGGIEDKRKEIEKESALLEKIEENLNKEWNISRESHRKGLYSDEELLEDKKDIGLRRAENAQKLNNLKEQLESLKDEETLKDTLMRELDKLVDSPEFEDGAPSFVYNQQYTNAQKKVLDNKFRFNEQQEFLNKFIGSIIVDYTGGLFELTINYKPPLTKETLYMDRKYYAVIEGSTKKVFDLDNPKQHNTMKELKKLTKDVLKLQDKKVQGRTH
ncbi:recombinase family protein [Arenibacter palladensis]|uniref:recombinase family protein n=1 Tax=Arenibacter palladensis TaxID=237373 RepID=UPI002FD36DEC